jgi:type IV secretory pathway VirB10-like protein
MYGCFEPFVVYGVMEGTSSPILDEEWLLHTFPPDDYSFLGIYASDVVRNIIGTAVYGFYTALDSTTGQVQPPTNEQKQCIQTLYEHLCNYWSAVGRRQQEEDVTLMTPEQKQEHEEKIKKMMPKMGYFVVVSGDYNTEEGHERYTPTAEDDEDDEEEENEQEQKEEEQKEEEEEEEEENKQEERKKRRTE